MRREFDVMLIILVCGLIGVITSVIIGQLNTNGIIVDEIISSSDSITIDDLMFFTFFAWVVVGIVIGVFKNK